MKKLRSWIVTLLSVVIVGALIFGGWFYINSVQDSLWSLSVTELKQVTTQASHALNVYFQKDAQNVHGLAINLSKVSSDDIDYIKSRIEAYNDESDGSFYTVIDMSKGVFYSTETESLCSPLPKDRMSVYSTQSGSGTEEPYISEVDGSRRIAVYECFTFKDGVKGIVRRAVPVARLIDEYSLNIYDGEGFSYVVNQNGDILIRSLHKSTSHTYLNVFEAMDAGAGINSSAHAVVESFRSSILNNKSGVLRFTMQDDEESVYAYVPISNTDGWYYISVVPSRVLMEQSNHILNISQLFLFIIASAVFVIFIVIWLVRKNRKAMEKIAQEVQYREQLFDILTNGTGDAFVMFTAKDEQVEYVSPNIDHLLGISPAELKENLSLIHNDGVPAPEYVEGLSKLEESGSFTIEQEHVHRTTGEHRWFVFTLYHVVINDTDKIVMVLSDRTLEKQKEQTLEEAMNIAESANKAKSTFLSNMSHDIRTPMNAIVGLCTLLQRDADNAERVRDYTKKITASSQHLLGLINDVLDMSKIEAGKTVLNISEINLAQIVEGLVTVLMPQARAKQQEFTISVLDVKSEHLLGDELRINQILINILSNAIKYTPAGGSIEMLIRELPQVTQNFARIRFIVKDSGIGMAPEYLHTIFQPFTREVNSNTNKIQGTGLGMTITKGLVDLMGGTISVESTLGEGSTFTVDLEMRIRQHEVDKQFWEKHGITQLLVVDDDKLTCDHIKASMENTGVKVSTALSGKEAIRQVKE